MGTRIKVSGLDLRKKGAFIVPPVSDNLEGFFMPWEVSSKAILNFARNKNDATQVGSPSYTTNHGSFGGGTKRLETEIEDSANFTIYMVCKTNVGAEAADNSAARPVFCGNALTVPKNTAQGVNSSFGITLSSVRHSGAGRLMFQACRGNTTNDQVAFGTSSADIDVNKWQLIMCRVNGLEQTLKSFTQDITVKTTATLPRLVGKNKISIGGNPNSTTLNGENQIALFAYYSEAHSDAQAELMADFIRNTVLSNKEITV